MMFPTTRAILLGLIPPLIIMIGGGGAGAVLIAFGLMATLVIACIVDGLSSERPFRLTFERHAPSQLYVDQPQTIEWIVENRTPRTIPLQMRDLPPTGATMEPRLLDSQLPPQSRTKLTYQLTPTIRGDHPFGDMYYRVQGPLGLAWRQRKIPAATPIRCFPHLANWTAADLAVKRALMRQSGSRRYRWKGTGTLFESLRDYAADDDIRWVDWKATARAQRPISRNFETERYQQVLLVIDASRMMTTYCGHRTKFDAVLEAAVLASHSVTDQGDSVGLLVFSDNLEVYLHPRRERVQPGLIMDSLYHRYPRLVEPDFETALSMLAQRNRRRSLVILFTDVTVVESARRMTRAIRALLPRHLPLVVTIADETVQALEVKPPTNAEEMYQVGIANELQQQREEILELLANSGCAIVDSPADQIAVRTIDTYIQLKQRMRL